MVTARTGGEDFVKELPKQGWQHAMVYAIVDLGLQQGSQMYPKPKFKLAILFELEEKMKEGKFAGQPFGLSNMVTNSTHEKGALTQMVRDMTGDQKYLIPDGADLDKLLIKRLCKVKIVHAQRPQKGAYAEIQYYDVPDENKQPWTLMNGKSVSTWKYPAWIQKMRDAALQPPEDAGCQWEPGPQDDKTAFHQNTVENSFPEEDEFMNNDIPI